LELPGVGELRDERTAFVATMDDLTDAEFDDGATLCTEWAPRDVLAHLMGIDTASHRYLLAGGNVGRANRRMVEQARTQPRGRIMNRARHWAQRPPPPTTQLMAAFLVGDVVMHHQDVLRGLGRSRELSARAREAIYREGLTLGPARWIKHRVEPVDGGFPFGFGRRVTGTCEALALWLAGRDGVEPELRFEGFLTVSPAGP
jgi:uncharacterized protein (TIGR03083 family)